MNKQKQEAVLVDYFRNGEKKDSKLRIGMEMEHFVLHKDTLTAVSYYETNGVETILQALLTNSGWQGIYEEGHLLGLEKDSTNISLEPGGQLEISIKPLASIEAIKDEYQNFLDQVIPILEANDQVLMAIGYHPVTKIADVKFIPKQRYAYMSDYLQRQGKYALNMMKGTAAMHINMDYRSESDYIKKYKVANCLAPVIAAMFDNSPIFEGEVTKKHAPRTIVWQNCDDDRCGTVPGTFNVDFGYKQYAQFILNTPPILVKKDTIQYTQSIKNKEMFDPDNYTKEELEYMLTMVFPDVRTKGHIEIRMSDSIPYPLNIAGVALWKGLLYHDQNLDELYQYFADIKTDDIIDAKNQVMQSGYQADFKGKKIAELAQYIVCLAKSGLSISEQVYLQPLERLVQQKKSLAAISKSRLGQGMNQALKWCVLNNVLEGGFNEFLYLDAELCQPGDQEHRRLL